MVLNRPYAFQQWVRQHLPSLPERYVLMLEPDHLLVAAPPLWATPTRCGGGRRGHDAVAQCGGTAEELPGLAGWLAGWLAATCITLLPLLRLLLLYQLGLCGTC